MVLERIKSPADVKILSREELDVLARELRTTIINTVSKTGGHLAPNLGVVELSIALHCTYETPKDKIVWDVGAQAYPHKLLTGRLDRFDTIRQFKGLSGFPNVKESEHDHFGTGHSSTSIGIALGMAAARDLNQDDYACIAVIGDGGMTGGVAFEGLNHAGHLGTNLLVILNDNAMSISPNLGGLYSHLNRITSGQFYNYVRKETTKAVSKIPAIGELAEKGILRIEELSKGLITPGLLFEELGFRYFGPLDGHDLDLLLHTFENVKQLKGPILMHVITEKGRGYNPAVIDPTSFHGAKPFDVKTGAFKSGKAGPPTFTKVFANTACAMAEKDKRVVAVTAAMREGTGLVEFAGRYPDRFFDVAIAEQHALELASGLATQGIRPIAAIYSTFLQRAFDQLYHDVCIHNLPVLLCLDRGGIVGADGATHQGLYDLSYLRCLPNMVVSAAADERDLVRLMWTALAHDGPFAVRYPRENCQAEPDSYEGEPFRIGEGTVVRSGERVAILAIGTMVYRALRAAEELDKFGIDPTIVNMRFVKPMDLELLKKIAASHHYLVTIEDNTIEGGFGSAVAQRLTELEIPPQPLLNIGVPDKIIEHGSRDEIFEMLGMSPKQIAERIERFVKSKVLV